MHQKELQGITDKRFAALQSHWPGMYQLNEDAIHDWRVELKKMRALIRLFKKFEKKASIHSSWKKLYDLTGEVRDRQVHLHLVKNLFESNPNFPVAYIALIEEELSTVAQSLQRVTENDVVLHMHYQTITHSLPSKISIQKLKDYIHHELLEVRNILWLTYKKDEYLHECRKHLKDAQYLLNMFDEQLSTDPIV
ncbi:MAG TPA: CHAD domain-containing protein, partial [Chitinophagaceae bacterium]|nr:CHAD domain-containing protein [Chitinophagaceae bacterium]